jgi:hypothetical protein
MTLTLTLSLAMERDIIRDEGLLPFIFWNSYPATTRLKLADMLTIKTEGEPRIPS